MDNPDASRVFGLVRRYGWNATSFQILNQGYEYWFSDDAVVAYVDTGDAWVVAGAPLAPLPRLSAVTRDFVDAARRHNRRVCFFAVEERFLESAELASITIGEQPVWHAEMWPDILANAPRLREQLQRARNKGVRVTPSLGSEIRTGPLRLQLDALVADWLASRRMPPLGFLVDVQPFSFSAERSYFLASQNGRVVGFLAAAPIYHRDGWLLEHLIRAPDAPNGTAELLIDAAMHSTVARGDNYVTLGLAPLSGAVAWPLALARSLTPSLFDFAGLRRFKAKLRPTRWDRIALAYAGDNAFLAVSDALRAFAGGSLTRFGAATAMRSARRTVGVTP